MALNANEDVMMALNTKIGNVTLNVKLRSGDDGSECRNSEWMVALIAKIGNANRNVKLGSDDGSDRRNRECNNDGSERQN